MQKKNFWGNWVYGDPTPCTLHNNWSYRFELQKNSTPFTSTVFYSTTLSTTPVYNTYAPYYWSGINYLVLNLHPASSGPGTILSCSGTGYDVYSSAVNVYTYGFRAVLDQFELTINNHIV